jgi:hypothetical protein
MEMNSFATALLRWNSCITLSRLGDEGRRERSGTGDRGHYGIKLPISINFRRHSSSYRTMKTEVTPESVDGEH